MDEKYYTPKQLAHMKRMGTGYPTKIADYVLAEKAYKATVDRYFDGEKHVFNSWPGIETVERFKKAAESGDTDDQARYMIIQDCYDYYNDEVRNGHVTVRELEGKLRSKTEYTRTDLGSAEELARRNPSVENLALFAKIQRQVNAR